jgi:hypothetical protein
MGHSWPGKDRLRNGIASALGLEVCQGAGPRDRVIASPLLIDWVPMRNHRGLVADPHQPVDFSTAARSSALGTYFELPAPGSFRFGFIVG